jgi:uncharacterized protein
MRGAERLQRHGIGFHAIAVVTADALSHAKEIFDFFVGAGIETVGFNIEETEGVHETSPLSDEGLRGRVKEFFQSLYDLPKASPGQLRIREFDRAFSAIAAANTDNAEAAARHNQQVLPFGILSVDYTGNVTTFSPELLGTNSPNYGSFQFLNLASQELEDMLDNPRFYQVATDVLEGVRQCAKTCPYFMFCGGGAPANKCFENGSFATTETSYCRYTIQMPLQIALADLENELGLTP